VSSQRFADEIAGLQNRLFRSIELCHQRAWPWGCDVVALPRSQQDTIVSQALQHYSARGRVHLPEATCLGEGEPQSGHLAKLSAHALKQGFHLSLHISRMGCADGHGGGPIVRSDLATIQMAKIPATPLSLLTGRLRDGVTM
jgi:hypothetical protein